MPAKQDLKSWVRIPQDAWLFSSLFYPFSSVSLIQVPQRGATLLSLLPLKCLAVLEAKHGLIKKYLPSWDMETPLHAAFSVLGILILLYLASFEKLLEFLGQPWADLVSLVPCLGDALGPVELKHLDEIVL